MGAGQYQCLLQTQAKHEDRLVDTEQMADRSSPLTLELSIQQLILCLQARERREEQQVIDMATTMTGQGRSNALCLQRPSHPPLVLMMLVCEHAGRMDPRLGPDAGSFKIHVDAIMYDRQTR